MVEDDLERFTIPVGSLSLLSGEELDPTAFLAFKTYGSLNAKRSNAILWVTCYNQRHTEMAPMIGRGKRFDPDTTGHFLITVNMPGNGVSWSPTSPGARWPKGGLTYHDCAAMVQLLVHSLGVEQLALIYGFSMGAMFALEYCVQFPRGAAAAVVVCGSARTNPANEYFLRTLHDTLRADPEAEVDDDGEIRGFGGNPRPAGMLEFASVYADWVLDGPRPGGPSPDASRPTYAISKPGARCYSEGLYKTQFGVGDMQEFEAFWPTRWAWDALEFYAVSDMWLRGDVSDNPTHNGDLASALGSIEAKVYLMPSTTDQYFISEEIEKEGLMIPNCEFHPLVSPMGHVAESAADMQPQIQSAIEACLNAVHGKL